MNAAVSRLKFESELMSRLMSSMTPLRLCEICTKLHATFLVALRQGDRARFGPQHRGR
jgi:hypothetical protein